MRAEARASSATILASLFRPIICRQQKRRPGEARHILHVASNSGRRRRKPGFQSQARRRREFWRLRPRANRNVVDKRLWTGIAKLVGGGHSSTALVGTGGTGCRCAAGLLRPRGAQLLIRGFDPLNDAREYGKGSAADLLAKKRLSARDSGARIVTHSVQQPAAAGDWLRQLTHIRQQMARTGGRA